MEKLLPLFVFFLSVAPHTKSDGDLRIWEGTYKKRIDYDLIYW